MFPPKKMENRFVWPNAIDQYLISVLTTIAKKCKVFQNRCGNAI